MEKYHTNRQYILFIGLRNKLYNNKKDKKDNINPRRYKTICNYHLIVSNPKNKIEAPLQFS